MIPVADYKWFGMPGHFISAINCRFRLCTVVGKWVVSTVGDYWPASSSEREEIGVGRLYETMVFSAGDPCDADGCHCEQPDIDGQGLDMDGYRTGKEAQAGHMAMCRKWAEKQ